MSVLLRALGGIPVDRGAPGGVVGQMVDEFSKRENFTLAIVPEGTRKGVVRLKTGFWHIAKSANVPIVCWYLDPVNKRTRWVGKIQPSASLDEDLRLISQLYEQVGFTIPAVETSSG